MVLHGHLGLAIIALRAGERRPVRAAGRTPARPLVNLVLLQGYLAYRASSYVLPVAVVLAVIGVFARLPWRLVAIADIALLLPLLWIYARYIAPMLLYDDRR